ncbi:MAG: DUF1905 domain-containing protein, partial [Rhodoluna sp.]|nr:DUF1905 domain-containing protein [Rhodoluna sp.]
PAPFFYVKVPDEIAEEIAALASQLTYGWGVIPVKAKIGKTTFTTSLFPKDGGYLLGLKVGVRKPENLNLGDSPRVKLSFDI